MDRSSPGAAGVPVAASVPSAANLASMPNLLSGTALVGHVADDGSFSALQQSLRPRRPPLMLWIAAVAVLGVVIGLIAMRTRHRAGTLEPSGAAMPASAGTEGPPTPAAPVETGAPLAVPPVAHTPEPGATAPDHGKEPGGEVIDKPAIDKPVAVDKPPVDKPPVDKPTPEVETPRERPKSHPPKERVTPRERPQRDPEPREPKDPPKEAVADGPPGWVSIDSDPYATIYVDGKKVGVTPLARIALPPGPHRVKAVSSQGGEQVFNVSIESNKEARGKKLAW
jgi:hypothetical protein